LIRDLPQNKRGIEALRGRELLEALFEHAPIGIAVTDTEARFVSVNPSFCRMLGYTEDELYGMTGWEVTYPDDIQGNIDLREELFEGKRQEFTYEKRYRRKDGSVVWVQNKVALIPDESGSPRYAMTLVEDISQRKLAHAAVHATADKLQALGRRLVQVQETERRKISRELHDRVGQALTALRINMDMIRARASPRGDPVVSERSRDSLELIESAFQAVRNVMYELRPPMLDEFGLVAPLQWYAKQFGDRTGIEVTVRGDESLRFPPDVELGLFRIAQEALNNVARHAKANGVVIEVRAEAQWLVLAVQDDGVGFEPPASGEDGAGYGLITMRERSEALGGTFEASSSPDTGTRITVRIPGSAAPPKAS
jgi:two-component system sensor histidine kinase UhpB